MKKTSLLATNSYLKDLRRRDSLLRQTVLTSSAIEGAGAAAARALVPDAQKQAATPAEASAQERH